MESSPLMTLDIAMIFVLLLFLIVPQCYPAVPESKPDTHCRMFPRQPVNISGAYFFSGRFLLSNSHSCHRQTSNKNLLCCHKKSKGKADVVRDIQFVINTQCQKANTPIRTPGTIQSKAAARDSWQDCTYDDNQHISQCPKEHGAFAFQVFWVDIHCFSTCLLYHLTALFCFSKHRIFDIRNGQISA